jgi:DUF1009 family protein
MVRRLAVLAGSGGLVAQVVGAAQRAGYRVQVLAFEEREAIPGAKMARADISNPLGIVWSMKTFRATHVVMAGGLHLSDRQREGLARFAAGGEAAASLGDAALSGLAVAVKKFTGAELLGVHEIAPDLLAEAGLIAGPTPDEAAMAAAHLAIAAARAIGRLDLGQAVVVVGARVVAAEDVAGTAELLSRVAEHRRMGLIGDGQGPMVLGKTSKPQQPAYVDLPAVGPDTVEQAVAAGVTLIAVEPLRTLLIDRPALIAAAEAHRVTILGLAPDA